jgi:Na+-driven multidrug efflux pump
MKQQNAILLESPVGRLMGAYAVPCIISLLVAALYNAADQIFIGWGVGAAGNSATNIVFPLTVMALAVAAMIGDAACSFISIRLGCVTGITPAVPRATPWC